MAEGARGWDGEPVTPTNPPAYDGSARATEAKREQAAEREATSAELERLAHDDPSAVIRVLFKESALAATEMYRRFNRSGRKDGARDLIDASREARQLADRLLALIEAEGSAAEAEQFLATVQARVEALAPRLADTAQPLVAPPA